MIKEIHKDCEGEIISNVLFTIPPIYVKECQKCGEKQSRQEKLEIKQIEL